MEFLQQTMDQYIFSFYNGVETEIMASVGLMPTQDYQSDDFQYIIASTLGIFYMLSFLYPVSRLIRALVLEKECRIKEGMKMMGLTSTIYNLSWLITTVLQMTLISVLITLVSSTTVFEYSNKFYVFIYFEAFSLAVINMCFLMAAFFSRSKTASLLGPMIFFATFFPYYSVSDPQYDQSSKAAACLLAPTCFALGANVFADYEGGLVGIQSDNVSQETSNFTYSLCVGMLFFDAFLYGILAWYCDKVIPSEFGTSLPFYFPLLPSYWCGSSSSNKYGGVLFGWIYELFGWGGYRKVSTGRELQQPGNELDSGLLDDVESVDPKKAKYFEPVSPDLKQQIQEEKCISIRKLRKVFKNPAGGDDRIAVAGLNLEMYQNQVTVMLGHNGAGKTTMISMLVGMIPPTSGNAMMPGGLDISNDMTQVRRNLGVCPQHDILFPELTALQHLEIFAAFKGVSPAEVANEAKKMLAEVSLKEKANTKSSTLSGGQKRKLSLGIALIGDSKVVILDEPTSGMDPFSRRSTWNIIQRNKRGRVILLTTHFLDEADKLGDRVAIMAQGKLMCCGSPLFLKNRFGVGYTLTIVKEAHMKTGSDALAAISNKISDLVTSFIPEAEPLSDVGAEQSLRLPFSASDRFVELFEAFDRNKNELGIAEYGISVTTLEEVFLKVADMEEDEEDEGSDAKSGISGEHGALSGQNVHKLAGNLKANKADDTLDISPKQGDCRGPSDRLPRRTIHGNGSKCSLSYPQDHRKITAVMEGEETSSSSSRKSNQIVDETAAGVNPLSEIFAKIEAKKSSLHVQEYSVGQTTLEQIFNQFASQQDNPEVAMAMANGDNSFRSSLENNRTRSSFVRVD